MFTPIVVSQNPHLRQLDRVVSDQNSLAALRGGMPLSVALDVAKGDRVKLREDLVAAKRLLQDACGKVLTGFTGDRDLVRMIEDILELTEAIPRDGN